MIQGRSHRAILPTDSSNEAFEPFGVGDELTINGVIRRTLADGNWKKGVLYDGLPRRSDDRRAKVLNLLARCRHGELGAKLYDCTACGARRMTLNSCGDRHCPACARQSRYVWHQQVLNWSLDCDYLHLVLTLPHEFNRLVAANRAILLRLLLDCVREAVMWLARTMADCLPGLILVLHTWGQRLNFHFHVHVVMTSGGLSSDGNRWIAIDQDMVTAYKTKLAERFKQLFMRRLRRMLEPRPASPQSTSAQACSEERQPGGQLQLALFDSGESPDVGVIAEGAEESTSQTTVLAEARPKSKTKVKLHYPPELPDRAAVLAMLEVVEAKQWVADIGTTPEKYRECGERRKSLGYVGTYVAGSAIGDGRLISDQDGIITFRAFDYRTDEYITLEMTRVEFTKAYSQHILPLRMHRVRFAGLFRAKGREERMRHCRELLVAKREADCAIATGSEGQRPEAAVDESDALEEGSQVLCTECQQEMQQMAELDGPTSCWLLKAALVLATWLSQRSADEIRSTIVRFAGRLQIEARVSSDRARWVTLTPGDTFFVRAHFMALEAMVQQLLADPGNTEPVHCRFRVSAARPGNAVSGSSRGPPQANIVSQTLAATGHELQLQRMPA